MRLSALLLASLLFACAPAGAPSDDSPGGGKADDAAEGAACTEEEFEAIDLCIVEACPDLSGGALEICLQESCGEDLERVADGCEICVLGGLEDGEELSELATTCTTAAEEALCSADDLEWLFFCGLEGCPGLSGDELHACMEDTCGADITSIDQSCRDCYVFYNDAGELEAGIEAYCGPGEVDTEAACVGADAETLELCVPESCPEVTGLSLEICIQENCGTDLVDAADECMSCVYDNVDAGAQGVLDACID